MKGGKTKPLVRSSSSRPLTILVRVLSTGTTFRLAGRSCIVGSGEDADLVIRDSTVSRHHLEVALAPEGVSITDLGSRNGTFYLDQRLEKATLALGAKLRIGRTEIVFEADLDALADLSPSREPGYRDIVGRSPAMRQLFGLLSRLEGSLVSVLLTGESGTGKEIVARAIHDGSRVASGPFIAVNCGAVVRDVIASQLFGHKRGAFTGAVENRRGAFELADGGTLFLDEIGELPIDLQPMLLRVLETGEVQSVGSEQATQVRVRVLAATNRDPAEAIKAGLLREDLFYRLAVVRIELPALRSRPEDVELLAQRFAEQLGIGTLPAAIIDELKRRQFPGNARELRNAVAAFAAVGVLPPDRTVEQDLDRLLGELVRLDSPYADQKDALVDRFSQVYLRKLLAHTAGNQAAAAKIAGLDRTYLGRLLARVLPSG